MPDAMICPPSQVLSDFGLGKLPEEVAAAVSVHLDSCLTCRQAVAAVPPDSFLDKVRAAGPAGSSFPPSLTKPNKAPSSANSSNLPPELANHLRYLVLRELGRGGMGVVYQARHKEMDRQVVIKVINRSLLDRPESLERFRREIRAAAQLSHPNIVAAYDAEQAGQSHMLVMEFVPGQSLAEVVKKKGPLPIDFACYFARQVALGLQHAYEHNMVHRDIKPQNLMLTPKGQIKILDFGLAKVVREEGTSTGLTARNAYMGTPDYCAPEQSDDAHKADIRADLYSLGCTLYCLLAGRPPFQEDTAMKTILAHIQREPRPLPELRPEVPAGLWQVVKRLLAKEPAHRYQTPTEVAQALVPFIKAGAKQDAKGGSALRPGAGSPAKRTMIESETEIRKILREVPGKASPKDVPGREKESSRFADLTGAGAAPKNVGWAHEVEKPLRAVWWKRPGVQAGAVGVSLALILLAAIIIMVWTPEGTIVLKNLPTDAVVTIDGSKVTAKWVDGKTAEIRVLTGKKHWLEVKLNDVKIHGEEVEVEINGHKPVLISLRPVVRSSSQTKPGKLPTEPEKGDLKPPENAEKEGVAKNHPPQEEFPREKPVKPEMPDTKVHNKKSKPKTSPLPSQLVLHGHADKIMYLVFTPDGSRLVSASNGNHIHQDGTMRPGPDNTDAVRIWSVESGNEIRRLRVHEGWSYGPYGIAVSPDGRSVAACTSWEVRHTNVKPAVIVWDVASGTRKYYFELPPNTPPMRAVGFSQDGNNVYALLGGQGIIHSWSVADGSKLREIALSHEKPDGWLPPGIPSAFVCNYVIGPGLVKGNDPWAVHLWDRESGQVTRVLRGHKGIPTCCTMSMDGTRVLSCAPDFSVRLWQVESGEQLLCLDNLDTHIRCVAISSDGKQFLTGGEDHTVRLWDSSSGKQLARYDGHTDIINCVAFSPDGRLAASGSNDKTIRLWPLPE